MSDTLLHNARNFYEQQAYNRRMTIVFILLFIIIFLALGIGFDLYFGISSIKSFFLLPMLILTIGSLIKNLQGRIALRLWDENKEEDDSGFEFETFMIKLVIGIIATFMIFMFIWHYQLLVYMDENTHSGSTIPKLFIYIYKIFEFLDSPFMKAMPWGTAITIIVTIVLTITSLRWGAQSIVWSINPIPSDNLTEKYTLLKNVTNEMSLAAGIEMPNVAIIEDDDPNAFAIGTLYSESTIVVTTGLFSTLNREELQGVVAHEISHIRNNDTQVLTVVTVLFGAILLISEWMRKMVFLGKGVGVKISGSSFIIRIIFFIGWVVTIIFAPLIARMLAMSVSRQREYLADANGAELTRNPLALASALSKIELCAEPTKSIPKSIAHFCVIDPLGRKINNKEGFWADLFSTHPPFQKRIMFLRSMAYHP